MPNTGISNREPPQKEEEDRKRNERTPDTARDQAGHVIKESREERLEPDERQQSRAPGKGDGPDSRREHRSRSGG